MPGFRIHLTFGRTVCKTAVIFCQVNALFIAQLSCHVFDSGVCMHASRQRQRGSSIRQPERLRYTAARAWEGQATVCRRRQGQVRAAQPCPPARPSPPLLAPPPFTFDSSPLRAPSLPFVRTPLLVVRPPLASCTSSPQPLSTVPYCRANTPFSAAVSQGSRRACVLCAFPLCARHACSVRSWLCA